MMTVTSVLPDIPAGKTITNEQLMGCWLVWKRQYDKGVVNLFDALLTLNQSQAQFVTDPSTSNWNSVLCAMFIYQKAIITRI